jgi:hypothetical protein
MKVIDQYCKRCDKVTQHTTPFYGFPHACVECAKGLTVCAKCQAPMKSEALDFAKALGATSVYCQDCVILEIF